MLWVAVSVLSARAYGFFPMQITRGNLSSECSSSVTLSPTLPLSCGEIRETSAALRANAACSVGDWSLNGRALRTAKDSSAQKYICIPVAIHIGTACSRSLPNTNSEGIPNLYGDGLRNHPARFKASSTIFVNWIDSSSWKTLSLYSVPLKTLKSAINLGTSTSDRGDFSLCSSAVASAACFRASVKCDSAAAACSLADLMSASNESASLRACPAMVRALADAVCAFLASVSALPRDASAAPALDNESLACLSAVDESETAVLAIWSASPSFAVKVSRMVWFACSSRPSRTNTSSVNPNSPRTPIVTRMPPAISINLGQRNTDIGHLSSSMNSDTGCQYSSIRPSETTNVDPKRHQVKTPMECSKLRTAASNAGISIRRYGGLAQPFLILILEGAPLLSRLLRQGGDFDLRELRMPSQVPRPVPAKNAGTRTGQPLDLRFYLERMGRPQ